jgi:tetratricopeptide (TPR) repeat protein
MTAEALFKKGMTLDADGLRDSAASCYKQALALDPTHTSAHINLGVFLHFKRKPDEALIHYLAAAGSNPNYALAYYNIGNAMDDLGKLEESAAAYRQALTIDPKYADAHYNLAVVLDKLGESGKAFKHWQVFAKLEPQGSWYVHAQKRIEAIKRARVLFVAADNSAPKRTKRRAKLELVE